MKQWSWMVLLLAAGVGGCVSKQDAANSAVRIFNAVPDGSRMALFIKNERKTSGVDYGTASPYVVTSPGQVAVKIDEALAANASPDTRTLDERLVDLAVNDELTLVVLGQEAGDTLEVVPIVTATRGVPIGKTRIQFIHAGSGLPPVDIYVVAPDTLPTASTPFSAGLAYKAYTGQAEITGGNSQIIVTAAGDPGTVLLESNPTPLPLEGTWLVAVVANPGLDAAQRPLGLVALAGTGSTEIPDKDTQAQARFVNVSPGSYAIDAFINSTTVGSTVRQDCDALTTEADTVLEECAQPFGFIGPFHGVVPGAYNVKMQKAADAGVTARSLSATLTAGSVSTFVIDGLIAGTDTTTITGLQTLAGTRRMEPFAQLRVALFSQAAAATLDGDPTTDRLELYITAACASLDGKTADLSSLVFGSDTGYRAYTPGDYQVTLARRDTATSPAFPLQILLSKRMTLAAGGILTELVTDSAGGVLPAAFRSIDDDPGLQDCPAP